ncbi:NAD(P)/FAD-dependent oxidoreductase [Pedobacter montanisoli]|uniref:FAD-dependent oxidoreductase n=1 Tax=Pedobacter montanisoli TaxID=2923277 RepID=A0ABS9ZZV4_9SPHI|nr:FAD-dependent oxidoreductase [Pedobacter montanisoli]MCJ0743850.1 FAD-dependent oxidoreductase [Pedobacter montanisoli]
MGKQKVIIIGAGITGLFSAYYLLQEGFEVTLIDKGNLTDNCSSGNAGMIVPSHFIPLAAPGMISKGIKWMFNSRSPFYVKPSLNPELLRWGIQFWKHANAKHLAVSAEPLRDFHLLSKNLYNNLTSEGTIEFGLKHKGILMLYKNAEVGEEEIHVAKQAKDLGLDVDILDAAQVQELEPYVTLDVAGAVHYKCDAHLYPNQLVQNLITYLKERGVGILTDSAITSIEIKNNHINAVHTAQQKHEADLFVLTGGAWLPGLAKRAGLDIPLMPGKGYSFMHQPGDDQIVHPALLLEAKVAVTPMNGQVRFGGTMEIAPVNNKINMKRVEGIWNAIPQYYRNYKVAMPQPDQIWYGFRPCSPDGLPYLGYTKKIENLIVAGGHGMMGVSLAPATGKMVAQLAARQQTLMDISLFSPDRFA